MSALREAVRIITPGVELSGRLFVGADGLPEVEMPDVRCDGDDRPLITYRPATLPAAWALSSPTCGDLYAAWREIEEIQRRLREAEQETPQPEDDITASKRHRALEDE